MKFEIFENPRIASKTIAATIPFDFIHKAMMVEVLEKFTTRVAHVIARDYLRTKGPALRKAINQEWVERRVRRAIREALRE